MARVEQKDLQRWNNQWAAAGIIVFSPRWPLNSRRPMVEGATVPPNVVLAHREPFYYSPMILGVMDYFQDRNVMITGGLGFVGSNLAHRLLDLGAKVTLVDSLIPEYGGNLFNVREIKDQVQINISDVRDPFALRHLVRDQEVLFNLAGQTSHLDSMKDPATDLEINCKAQLSILETCRAVNPAIRIVFASTRQIYGRPEYLPVDEDHPIRPVDVNGINKTAGEWYHLLYASNYGIPCCVLRLTNTYGPRMRSRDARQTFLGVWLRLLIEGQPIPVYGDGTQRRDLNFVDDVVEALLIAAANPASHGQAYNLGGKEVITLRELARLLIDIHGQGSYEFHRFPPTLRKIDVGDYVGDYRRIQSELGWSPRTNLRDGLSRTIDFYRRYGHQYWD